MVEEACAALEAAGVTDKPGVVLADAGYWRNDAIEAIVNRGIQTLVAPDADSRKEPRPGRRGGLYDFVRRVLQTDWGKQLYSTKTGVGRVGLRSDQGESRSQAVPASRSISRVVRVAVADGHPQPPETPPTQAGHRLKENPAFDSHPPPTSGRRFCAWRELRATTPSAEGDSAGELAVCPDRDRRRTRGGLEQVSRAACTKL